MDEKRLFFGVEAHAPWPETYPKGRVLEESHRHMTLAFLGNVDFTKISDVIPELPLPSWKIGLAAMFDKPLFLPKHSRQPRVIAWHVAWLTSGQPLLDYQLQMTDFLIKQEYHLDKRPFLPHVTIARAPFYVTDWKKHFVSIPCFFSDIHLYESKGGLRYEPIWSAKVASPFDEIEHTADIAFIVRGENLAQLYTNALLALAFRFPLLINYFFEASNLISLNDIVKLLNESVLKADSDLGCPFKAISYHGDLKQSPAGYYEWEMIVDV